MKSTIVCAAVLCAAIVQAQPVPLNGITHVAFRIGDLEKSRAFYQKLGFEQAFAFTDDGKTVVAFMKINDHQFIELYPRTAANEPLGLMHVCFETDAIQAVHDEYVRRKLEPSEVRKARAGNLLFSLKDPEGQVLEYLQYLPGSLHVEDRGKHLGAARISEKLTHVVGQVRNASAVRAFYKDRLSLGEELQVAAAGGTRLVFTVPDVRRAAGELRRRVLPVQAAAETSVTDPDGAVIVLSPEPPRTWTGVADRLIETPVESYQFNWGEGVQMMGLMKAARATRNPRYIDYVEKWAQLYEPQPLEKLLNIGPAVSPKSRAGYCGHWSPASAILYLYQERRKPEHLKLVHDVVDFIRNGAERSPEGGLGHWQGSHQMWVDTVFMAAPLLAGLGQMEKKPEYIDDAANQVIVHARHLQDEKTGLIYHMYDWQTGTHSDGFWGRGDGWVLMSIADTMETMDRRHAKYGELASIAQRLAKGLEATQDSTGLWHTVLDDPDSYPETSATAMFTYGFLKLVRLGVLPAKYRAPAMKAWQTINEKYVQDGVVVGVSAGTNPGGVDSYRTRACGKPDLGHRSLPAGRLRSPARESRTLNLPSRARLTEPRPSYRAVTVLLSRDRKGAVLPPGHLLAS